MKYLLLISLTGLSLYSRCQEPPKGVNMVVVNGVGFKEIADTLLDRGFKIEKIDNELQTLQTSHYGPRNIAYYVRVRDSTAFIQGDRAGYLIDYSWKKDFAAMILLAKAFNHEISFTKK